MKSLFSRAVGSIRHYGNSFTLITVYSYRSHILNGFFSNHDDKYAHVILVRLFISCALGTYNALLNSGLHVKSVIRTSLFSIITLCILMFSRKFRSNFRSRLVTGGTPNSFPLIVQVIFSIFQVYDYNRGSITHQYDDSNYKDANVFSAVIHILFSILLHFGLKSKVSIKQGENDTSVILTAENFLDYIDNHDFDKHYISDDGLCARLIRLFYIDRPNDLITFCRIQLIELCSLIQPCVNDFDDNIDALMNYLLNNLNIIQNILVDNNGLKSKRVYQPVQLNLNSVRSDGIILFAYNVMNNLCSGTLFVYKLIGPASRSLHSFLLDLCYFIMPTLYNTSVNGQTMSPGVSHCDIFEGVVIDPFQVCINISYRMFGFEPVSNDPNHVSNGQQQAANTTTPDDTGIGGGNNGFDNGSTVPSGMPNPALPGKQQSLKRLRKSAKQQFSTNMASAQSFFQEMAVIVDMLSKVSKRYSLQTHNQYVDWNIPTTS